MYIPVCGQSVHRVAGERVPPLVLVDVKILGVLDWSDAELAGGHPLEVCTTPTACVDPGDGIVAERPGHVGRGAGLDLEEVAAAQDAPIHLRGRNYDLLDEGDFINRSLGII